MLELYQTLYRGGFSCNAAHSTLKSFDQEFLAELNESITLNFGPCYARVAPLNPISRVLHRVPTGRGARNRQLPAGTRRRPRLR